jgi:hypothetical protein
MCDVSDACETPSRPALVSIANARHCSAVKLIAISLVAVPPFQITLEP